MDSGTTPESPDLLDVTVARALARLRPDPPAAEVAQIHADPDPIGDALDAVLSAILAHEASRRAEAPSAPIGSNPIRWHRDVTEIPTGAESEIAALAADPVGAALRQAVRRLGQRLHERGGTDAMREAIDRVADRDPAHVGRRASIMDHAWNAVGTDVDRWWT